MLGALSVTSDLRAVWPSPEERCGCTSKEVRRVQSRYELPLIAWCFSVKLRIYGAVYLLSGRSERVRGVVPHEPNAAR